MQGSRRRCEGRRLQQVQSLFFVRSGSEYPNLLQHICHVPNAHEFMIHFGSTCGIPFYLLSAFWTLSAPPGQLCLQLLVDGAFPLCIFNAGCKEHSLFLAFKRNNSRVKVPFTHTKLARKNHFEFLKRILRVRMILWVKTSFPSLLKGLRQSFTCWKPGNLFQLQLEFPGNSVCCSLVARDHTSRRAHAG